MKKRILALAGLFLFLCGCGEQQVGFVPFRPEKGPDEHFRRFYPHYLDRNQKGPVWSPVLEALALSDTDVLIDWAHGDLNGDGVEDAAAVVEHRAGIEREADAYSWNAPRSLVTLLGDGEGAFQISQVNRELVGRDLDGGMFGDPYEGLYIRVDGLHFSEYGGSSSRWNPEYVFTWQGDGLALDHITEIGHSTFTMFGTREEYDFINRSYAKYTLSMSEEGWDRLIYEAKLNRGPWRLEEMPRDWVWGESGTLTLPPLPYLGDEYGNRDFHHWLTRSAEEILDTVKEKYYPDMKRVEIPWTEQTWENYSDALGYPVPRYYYTDGEGTLSYFEVDYHHSYHRYMHHVMYDGENSEFYWFWDDSGEEWDVQTDRLSFPEPSSRFPADVLGLVEHDILLDWAQGDLNGDGLADLAAVVEHREGDALPDGAYFWNAPRTLRVLLKQEDGSYAEGQKNGDFVRTDIEGGMCPEPFGGLRIDREGLHLKEAGGSAIQWSQAYLFAWREGGMTLIRVRETALSTHTGKGITDCYDFDTGTFRRRTYRMGDEDEHRLLWSGALALPGWRLEDMPGDEGFHAAVEVPEDADAGWNWMFRDQDLLLDG